VNPNETRILFVGDMHLGTRLSRVPAAVGDPRDLGPGAAWLRTCGKAVDLGVHAVALAGDVVNRRNELFEAHRPLDQGLGILADAGIPVVAVAGNHDTTTLPKLAARDPRLELLGPDGTWTTREVTGPGGPTVRITGWSFPREHWDNSPLATPPPAAMPGRTTFGLLHGDLDATGSHYAPVSSTGLLSCNYEGWFLGHIHTPGQVPDDGRPFYLGSLSGLDPTETDRHGPLLVTVGQDGAIERERLDLAPLRWDVVEIPCADLHRPEDDPVSVVLGGLESHVARIDPPPGMTLGVRVILTGEVERPEALADAVARLDPADLVTEFGGTVVFVDRLECRVRARIDLPALARGADPVGLLARRVLVLEGGIEDGDLLERLLETARSAVAEVDHLPACRRLDDPWSPEGLRSAATRSAHRLLHRMLASKDGAP